MKKLGALILGVVLAGRALAEVGNVFNVLDYVDPTQAPDYTSAFQLALRDAGFAYATTGKMSEVQIPAGTYELASTIHIYSGTIVCADPNARIVCCMKDDGGLLRSVHFDESGVMCEGGQDCRHGGYSQIHDVAIIGGIWDRASPASANTYVIQIRHGENIAIMDMTIRGATNHLLNLSGCRHVEVSGVCFEGAVAYTGGDAAFWGTFKRGDSSRYKTIEALHLDIIDRFGKNESAAYPLDDTGCDKVVVSDCEFKGVFAGVGTHHVNDVCAGEVDVEHCLFTGLKGFACYAYGYQNFRINDCTVEGGFGAARIEGKKTQCTIDGLTCTKSTDNAIHVDTGATLFLLGSTISDVAKSMAAVRVVGGSSAGVEGCQLINPGMKGFSVDEASILIAKKNTITRAGQYGIYCVGKSALTASGNTISAPGESGLMIKGSSTATVSSNKIVGAEKFGVRVSESTKATVSSNTIADSAGDGIFVDGDSTVTVSSNKITTSAERGIRLQNCSTKSMVSKNTIDTTGAEGIYFNGCTNGTISGNKIRKTKGYGIRVQGTSGAPAAVTISGNDVGTGSPTTSADIRLGDYCVKCKVSNNTLVNKLFSISKVGTSGNVYTPPATTLTTVTLDKTLKASKVTWTAQKMADGYEVQYATDSAFTKPKSVKVAGMKTVSAKLSNLDPSKSYYVRVRTYAVSQKVTYYSAWSAARVLVPDYFKGNYSGYCLVKKFPALVSLNVKSAECVTGEITFKGKVYPITEAQITAYSAEKATAAFKTQIVIGKSSWTVKISLKRLNASIGAVKASVSLSDFVLLAERDTKLCAAAGALKALAGTKVSITAAKYKGTGLASADKITIEYGSALVKVTSVVKGKKNTYTMPLMVETVATSWYNKVYTAKLPLENYSAGYGKLLTATFTVDTKGKISSKYACAALQ